MIDRGRGEAASPLLSAIVCSYTTARLGDVCEVLMALQGQSYPNLETVFVSDRSPELEALVRELVEQRGLDRVRVVLNDGRPGLAAARNVGVEQAAGDILAFIDDDALPFPDWGEEIVRTLHSDEGIVGVTGPAFPIWEDETLTWLPEEFYWLISCPTPGWLGCGHLRQVRNAWGMNMAFRREAFQPCRFPEAFGYTRSQGYTGPANLLGEDTAFSLLVRRRTGKQIVFNPRARVHHKVYRQRLAPASVRRRAFWEGFTKARLRRLGWAEPDMGVDLTPERVLLRRLALGFLPRVLSGLPRWPGRSWRELRLALEVLSHVAMGYAAASLPTLGRALCRYYAS